MAGLSMWMAVAAQIAVGLPVHAAPVSCSVNEDSQ
jgi:hypothetical protein